jgi:hypothetical protein
VLIRVQASDTKSRYEISGAGVPFCPSPPLLPLPQAGEGGKLRVVPLSRYWWLMERRRFGGGAVGTLGAGSNCFGIGEV